MHPTMPQRLTLDDLAKAAAIVEEQESSSVSSVKPDQSVSVTRDKRTPSPDLQTPVPDDKAILKRKAEVSASPVNTVEPEQPSPALQVPTSEETTIHEHEADVPASPTSVTDETQNTPDILQEPSTSGLSEADKKKIRRTKNNLASKVCRANRKRKISEMPDRIEELEKDNAELEKRIKQIKTEIDSLKKALKDNLLRNLSQTTPHTEQQ